MVRLSRRPERRLVKRAEGEPSGKETKMIDTALTFDDVLLIPQFSEVTPTNVSTETHFARGKILKAPIMSAPMDTVTEKDTAIAIAREGGIGIIHKNMTVTDQADHVRSVKRSESGMACPN